MLFLVICSVPTAMAVVTPAGTSSTLKLVLFVFFHAKFPLLII